MVVAGSPSIAPFRMNQLFILCVYCPESGTDLDEEGLFGNSPLLQPQY